MSNTINVNQFQQTPVRGQLDLQISKSGVITGQVASGTNGLEAGDFVKLDSSNTGPIPQFVAAAVGDTGFGAIVFDVKRDTYDEGDEVQVGFLGGPVVWLVAGGSVAPGAAVEDDGSGGVVTKSANAQKGIALDPGTTGNLMRVILTPVIVA